MSYPLVKFNEKHDGEVEKHDGEVSEPVRPTVIYRVTKKCFRQKF